MKLTDEAEETFRLLAPQKKALAKLKIENIGDILYHFPNRYGENFEHLKIEDLSPGKNVTVYGKIKSLNTGKTFRGRRPIAKASVEDETGTIRLIWFSQPYIAKMFNNGELVRVEGKVGSKKTGNSYSISNPQIERVAAIPEGESGSLFSDDSQTLHPIYPESRGITSNWFFNTIKKILKSEIIN